MIHKSFTLSRHLILPPHPTRHTCSLGPHYQFSCICSDWDFVSCCFSFNVCCFDERALVLPGQSLFCLHPSFKSFKNKYLKMEEDNEPHLFFVYHSKETFLPICTRYIQKRFQLSSLITSLWIHYMKYHKRVFQADFLGSRKSSQIQVLLGRIVALKGQTEEKF